MEKISPFLFLIWLWRTTDRVFKDDDITHVEGEVDPVRDIQIINDELRLKDLQAIDKPMKEMEKCEKHTV